MAKNVYAKFYEHSSFYIVKTKYSIEERCQYGFGSQKFPKVLGLIKGTERKEVFKYSPISFIINTILLSDYTC